MITARQEKRSPRTVVLLALAITAVGYVTYFHGRYILFWYFDTLVWW